MEKKVLKVELKKAFRSKGFLLAVLAGMVISILQTVWVYNNIYSVNQAEFQHVTGLSYMDDGYGSWFETGILEGWLGCEIYSPYNQMFFIIFPLLSAMPYGISFFNEWNSGYAGQMMTRCGRKTYLYSKFIAVFISGGLAVTIPLLYSLLTAACYLPAVGVDPLSLQAVVAGRDIWAGLYYEFPVLYAFCYMGVDFVYGGIFACITLAVSKWFTNRFAAILFPLLVYCTFYFGVTSLFPDFNVYNAFIHINPAQKFGTDQLFILTLMTAGIFLGVVFIYIWSNRRRDAIGR